MNIKEARKMMDSRSSDLVELKSFSIGIAQGYLEAVEQHKPIVEFIERLAGQDYRGNRPTVCAEAERILFTHKNVVGGGLK